MSPVLLAVPNPVTLTCHTGGPYGDGIEQQVQEEQLVALAQMLADFASMQREHAAANRHLLGVLQSQAEVQTRVLEQLVSQTAAVRPPAPSPSVAGLSLHKMSPADDPQSFLDMFVVVAGTCGWPEAEWAVRLLPLLSGDAQTAALQLPPASRQSFGEVRRAVLDRLGLTPEDHRRRFRGARLGHAERPFAFAQQLRDAARRWLQPGSAAGEEEMVETLVMEQFVVGLPAETSA